MIIIESSKQNGGVHVLSEKWDWSPSMLSVYELFGKYLATLFLIILNRTLEHDDDTDDKETDDSWL